MNADTKTLKITLSNERYAAFEILAAQDGRTAANALQWLVTYAIDQNSLCPMAIPQHMPTEEAIRRVTSALREPWEPDRPAYLKE